MHPGSHFKYDILFYLLDSLEDDSSRSVEAEWNTVNEINSVMHRQQTCAQDPFQAENNNQETQEGCSMTAMKTELGMADDKSYERQPHIGSDAATASSKMDEHIMKVSMHRNKLKPGSSAKRKPVSSGPKQVPVNPAHTSSGQLPGASGGPVPGQISAGIGIQTFNTSDLVPGPSISMPWPGDIHPVANSSTNMLPGYPAVPLDTGQNRVNLYGRHPEYPGYTFKPYDQPHW